MLRALTFALVAGTAAPSFAQITTGSPAAAVDSTPATQVQPLTLQEAEQRALDRNPQVAQARLGKDSAAYTIAESRAAYSPTFNATLTQRSQTTPATSQLAGGQQQVNTDGSSYSSGVAQSLPWGGGHYSIDFTGSRTATSNVFSTFNPSFASGLTATITQPLLRGLRFDQNRAAIEQAQFASDIADAGLRGEMAATLAAVRHAYWELVYATDALSTARTSEELAATQLADNQRRVALGTLAPIDVVESQAEVAARHQAVVQAQGALRTAQVALKELIVADTNDPLWGRDIAASDRPDNDGRIIDVAQAVKNAVANRTDIAAARSQRAGSDTSVRLAADLRKPAVDLVATYGLSGIGGTQILRNSTALGGDVTGTVAGGYLDVLRSLGAIDYPAWTAGVNVTLPLGKKAADAAYARAQVERRQDDVRIQALELQAAAQVTRLAEQVTSAQEQVRAAAAARELAQQRLDAEGARRNAGLSTNFQVLQAQRDLATAQTSELRAQLDYRAALVDFDLAQVAAV